MTNSDIVRMVSGDPNAQVVLNAPWAGHVAYMGERSDEVIRRITPTKIVLPLGRNLSQRRRDAVKDLLQGAEGVPGGTVYYISLKRPQGTGFCIVVVPRDEKLDLCIESKRSR